MPKPAPVTTTLIAPAVDERHLLKLKLAPYKADISRLKLLDELLRASVENEPADKVCTVQGVKYFAVLQARTNQVNCNCVTLLKLVGIKVFGAIVSCSKKALEENKVDPAVMAQVMETTQTGWRPLDTFARTT
jgi:hypothetical protein